jgi:Zn-dependent protease
VLFKEDFITRLPYLIAALIPALTFHEWGHAYMAQKFGDDTPRQMGRLSLNPLAHLDPLGTMAILLIGFGWAKPVPINPSHFKNRWGAFWVAFAGPVMNFSLAIVFATLLNVGAPAWFGVENIALFTRLFQISLFLNLALCFFNLIPIGPLDGNHILAGLLPLRASFLYSRWNALYGGTILFGLIIVDMMTHLNILTTLVTVPVYVTSRLLLH